MGRGRVCVGGLVLPEFSTYLSVTYMYLLVHVSKYLNSLYICKVHYNHGPLGRIARNDDSLQVFPGLGPMDWT